MVVHEVDLVGFLVDHELERNGKEVRVLHDVVSFDVYGANFLIDLFRPLDSSGALDDRL